MTNKDKYLKEGASVEELIQNLTNYINKTQKPTYEKIKNFFEQKAHLLTEDERVILRNIKEQPIYISRQKGYGLMAYDKAKRASKTGWSYDNGREMSSFSHLFQFIKERRRIRDKRIIGGKIN